MPSGRDPLNPGRGYQKTDRAWVEQRNWIAVRRRAGYERYASKAAYAQLQALNPLLSQQLNFLRPMRKLVGKARHGATVRKSYDAAQTPYQRVLAAGVLTTAQAHTVAAAVATLNPASLAR